MDPAECFKFGLKWNDQYFLDKSVAFFWDHRSASFQLLFDAVVYLMRDQVKLHCYIDDYVAVLLRFARLTQCLEICALN